ncbi:MAG: four helix bundle protein [Limisphaerales bacterium]
MYSKAPPKPAPQVFRTFEDLEVYRAAREFRKAMYAVTRKLPAQEKFELASQIRRAAVSLTNNIAEGHGRHHFLDQIKFQLQARGSLTELIDDLNICSDEKYLPPDEIVELKKQATAVHQLINGYIRYLRERKTGADLALREDSSNDAMTDEELDAILAEPIQPFNNSTI